MVYRTGSVNSNNKSLPLMITNTDLRKRFAKFVLNHWHQNNHSLENISCVYAILSLDIYTKELDIAYVGSTTRLFERYKSHKIPGLVQSDGLMNILFYLPMKKGFYDYEIKLIKKLQPKFNKHHKK